MIILFNALLTHIDTHIYTQTFNIIVVAPPPPPSNCLPLYLSSIYYRSLVHYYIYSRASSYPGHHVTSV